MKIVFFVLCELVSGEKNRSDTGAAPRNQYATVHTHQPPHDDHALFAALPTELPDTERVFGDSQSWLRLRLTDWRVKTFR